jgi:hypothetical protein
MAFFQESLVQGRAVKPAFTTQPQTAQHHIVHVQPRVTLAQGIGPEQGHIGPGLLLNLVRGLQGRCLLGLGQVQIAWLLQAQRHWVIVQPQVRFGLAQKRNAILAQADIDRAGELLTNGTGRKR